MNAIHARNSFCYVFSLMGYEEISWKIDHGGLIALIWKASSTHLVWRSHWSHKYTTRYFVIYASLSIDDIWIITISNKVISLFHVRIPLLLLIITVHFSHRENQFLISLQWWFKHIQPLWDRKKVLWLCAQTRMDHSQQLTPVTTNSVIPSLW